MSLEPNQYMINVMPSEFSNVNELTPPVGSYLMNTGDSFTTRMKKKSKSLLWEMTDEEFDLCWKVVEVLPTWHIGRELFGLGGSRVMRLKDLVDGRPMTFKTEDI